MKQNKLPITFLIAAVGLIIIFAVFLFINNMARLQSQRGYVGMGGSGMMGQGMMGGYGGPTSTVPSPPVQSSATPSSTSQTGSAIGNYQVVKVTASNWKWALSNTHFKYGEPIKFIVSSIQGTHGFSIMGTNISAPISEGGQPQTIIWNPNAKGTYTIACNIYCGPGHSSMVTTFTVS